MQLASLQNEYAWRAEVVPELTTVSHDRLETVPASAWHSLVASTLDKLRPDVCAVAGYSHSGMLEFIRSCVSRGKPVVLMSDSRFEDELRHGWKELLKRRVVRLCAAALVAGRPHAAYLVRLGMPRDRVFLGYDAVDNYHFAERATEVRHSRCEVRAKYGLPHDYFVASARFIEKKNLRRLIQAYALYRQKAENRKQEGESWSLVLLGDGSLRASLLELRCSLGLERSVLLPGFKQYNELPVCYGLAGAFVHASTTEQWGLVVNEAMASGLPVLVSKRCGCAEDLVQEGVNGFTFDPYDVEHLARLMLKVSGPGFPLSAFGTASRRIIANWGPERFAQGLRSAVGTALKVGSKRATTFERLLLRTLMLR